MPIKGKLTGPFRARFWTYAGNGDVRLSLAFGQSLTYATSSQTDEGWAASEDTWTFTRMDGVPVILREWSQDGQDCDGRLTRYGAMFCPLDKLGEGFELDGIRYPDWRPLPDECGQRDEFAEKAGY